MILFFDTETTGLPENWKAPVTDLDNWPRLVQLAYLVYDFDGNLIHSSNEIVKPNGFTIPVDASNVHGITTDIANQRGSKIEEVFELFSIHLKRAKVLVAHNMAYDEKIIGSEMIRLGMENTVDSKEKICTMESTVDLCKIDGPYGYKWPKLEELHRFLFNHDFDGAHDALADIQATAKCFWELNKRSLFKKQLVNKNLNFTKIMIDDDLARFITLFKSNLQLTKLLISIYYPFSNFEITKYWDTIIKGDAHYTCTISDVDTVYQPKLGLCFNKNISWNPELRKKWSAGIWDPFLCSIVGIGLNDADSIEDSTILAKIIPLDLKSEIQNRNDQILDFYTMNHLDPDFNVEPPYTIDMDEINEVYKKLDFSTFKRFFESKSDIVICNESIWDNTLKEIFTKERVSEFLNYPMAIKTEFD
ncbi:MAG: hypothetical protein RL737_2169, partial [Bacteroidota bacterium]